jgi:hypothetical protein
VSLATQTSTQGVPKVHGGVLRPVAVAVASGARGGDASGVQGALRRPKCGAGRERQREVRLGFEAMWTESAVRMVNWSLGIQELRTGASGLFLCAPERTVHPTRPPRPPAKDNPAPRTPRLGARSTGHGASTRVHRDTCEQQLAPAWLPALAARCSAGNCDAWLATLHCARIKCYPWPPSPTRHHHAQHTSSTSTTMRREMY